MRGRKSLLPLFQEGPGRSRARCSESPSASRLPARGSPARRRHCRLPALPLRLRRPGNSPPRRLLPPHPRPNGTNLRASFSSITTSTGKGAAPPGGTGGPFLNKVDAAALLIRFDCLTSNRRAEILAKGKRRRSLHRTSSVDRHGNQQPE